MSKNYTIYHLHSDISTATTNIDSVTKYYHYIERAKSLGMTALAFSEHGNIFKWFHKKTDIEKAGMKYIHACEFYISEKLEKIRDNYHCVLIARNYEGFKEINRLNSIAYNRKDGHFYYVPRISFDELIHTSDNIIITTACLGGILNNGSEELQNRFINFLCENKHRCFLEIQHHRDLKGKQKKYNQKLYELSKSYKIPLIAGTDTHSLTEEYAEARGVLQQGKKANLKNGEDDWDMVFKTYDELCVAYQLQGALPENVYLEAIENTNIMADMVEAFELDYNTKYPKIYDESYETFKAQINEAYKHHPYIRKRYDKEFVLKKVLDELDTYEKTKSIDFMLLQTYLRNWEKENGIACGYGRGSVSGSVIAYILGITEMDSIKFDLNFFRFMNPSRVTNADIDTDYSSEDRDKVKRFILKDHMGIDNIKSAEIITFNTIEMKGAIKDIGRGLGMSIQETQKISDAVIDNQIDNSYRDKYPELFKYVDIVTGVIVSVGSHPSGVLVSDNNIEEMIGLCSLSTSDYPVSMLNMKELDALMYVKLDILGLNNFGVINQACKLAGIERLTPDNVDLNDENVWKSIRDDTTLIFQWESDSAQAYLKKFMSDSTIAVAKSKTDNFSWIKWFSFGNGLLRPGCTSYRDEVANGIFYENGLKELDDFLAPTMGHVTMQEDIMQFLVKFCGYTEAESDTVRRGIAKKYGTDKLLPEIEQRFEEYTSLHYGVSKERCREIIKPFLKVIQDASSYAFSWNHSDSYSCIGYICGYLRYYYPYEFLTAALNVFEEDEEKTNKIISYAIRNGIDIKGIKFRHSVSEYTYSKDTKSIHKGISSIKYLNRKISKELYGLRENEYETFIDLLYDIKENTSVNARQLDILIKLDFFSEFGDIKELLEQYRIFDMLFSRKNLKISEANALGLDDDLIESICQKKTKLTLVDVDIKTVMKTLCQNREYPKTTIMNKIEFELEYLGYISVKFPNLSGEYAFVMDVSGKFSNKIVRLYRLNNGEIESFKVKGKSFNVNPIEKGMIIKTIEAGESRKWRKDENGEWYQIDETETILYKWSKVK
ncbi:PHP domain-containing protein [Anaerovoracaceae bacterium 41-7]